MANPDQVPESIVDSPENLRCPNCGSVNSAGTHECSGCHRPLGEDDRGSASILHIPIHTPRPLATTFVEMLTRQWGGVIISSGVSALAMATIFSPMVLAFWSGWGFPALFWISFALVCAAFWASIILRALSERHALRHGELVRGDVTEIITRIPGHERRWGRVIATERRRQGPPVTHSFVIENTEILRAGLRIGDDLPMVVLSETTALAPSLMRVHFTTAADRRPLRISPPNQSFEPAEETWTAPLKTGLASGVLWLAFMTDPITSLSRLFAKSDSLRQLEVSGRVLAMTGDGASCPRIDLSRPFTLEATTWLLNDDEAELSVTIRARDARPGDQGLRFRVTVPQSRVGRSVPVMQGTSTFLAREDFDRLWPTLVHCAAVHGIKPIEVAGPPTEAGSPQRAAVAQVHRSGS